MTTTLTRTAAGATVPTAGNYDIDPAHSSASFEVRHLGISKVRGGFESFSGTVVIDDEPARSSVEVELDASTFSTSNEDRDAHVRSADFLDVENYPMIKFRSTGARQEGERWKIDGELTVKEETRPVTLDVEFEGAGQDPWGNGRIAFSATAELDRGDWGINWNQTLETGGLLVGKKVKVLIDVQAVAAS